MESSTCAIAAIWPAHAPAVGDDETRVDGRDVARSNVGHLRRDDPLPYELETDHAAIRPGFAAVRPGVLEVGRDQLPAVDRRAGQSEDAADLRVERRFAPERVREREILALDVRCLARGGELGHVVFGVVGSGDVIGPGVLDGCGGDPPEYPVLVDALPGSDRVLDRVSPAGMEQAVESPGRARSKVPALYEEAA